MRLAKHYPTGLSLCGLLLILRLITPSGTPAPLQRGGETIDQHREKAIRNLRDQLAENPSDFDRQAQLVSLLCRRDERVHLKRTDYGDRPQVRPMRKPVGELADALHRLRSLASTPKQWEIYERLYRRACGYVAFPELHVED